LATVDLVRLKSRLYDIIILQEDQLLFIPLCNRCADGIEALGRPVEKHDARDVVMVV
jgi:CRISPR/Cas system-associated endoribonuclease Cas2